MGARSFDPGTHKEKKEKNLQTTQDGAKIMLSDADDIKMENKGSSISDLGKFLKSYQSLIRFIYKKWQINAGKNQYMTGLVTLSINVEIKNPKIATKIYPNFKLNETDTP